PSRWDPRPVVKKHPKRFESSLRSARHHVLTCQLFHCASMGNRNLKTTFRPTDMCHVCSTVR
ncbi:MAG: hypothetical protein AAFS10_20685, partial [Myxococcota bacterium]